MHPSMATWARSRPIERSYAFSTETCNASKTPAAIHSSRRRRIVVAEQVTSASRSYPAPKTSACTILSNTIWSSMRGR